MGVRNGRGTIAASAYPKVRTGVAIAAAAVLSACVTADQSGPAQFSFDRADEVFLSGYDSIATRYVDDISVADVAAKGLDGLSDVDADITVARDSNHVSVTRHGALLASFPAPADDDVRGWSDLTVKVLKSGRNASMRVAAASPERLYEAVFDSALTELDEYSRYAGTDLARLHRDLRDGFGGIGFDYTMTPDRALSVTTVLPDTPAANEGLKVGDVITDINGTPVFGMDREELARLLRGRVNSEVTVSVRRAGSDGPVLLTFQRALILPPTVTARVDSGIAYLTVSSFNHKTAGSVASKFAKLTAETELKGVVLDLRNNPGGLLDQAVAVADLFLERGEIVATHGRHPDSNQQFDASGTDIAQGLPMVVLINGESASAAEIVAAALQDQGRAVLVGSNSFGKGTVQNVIHLPNDGELTLTWSRIEAPSGYVFHHKGLMPALCTSRTDAAGPKLMAELQGGKIETGALLAAWRAADDSDQKTTEELRQSCPPSRDATKADTEVARDVIGDSELYAQVIRLGAPTITASTAGGSTADTNAAAVTP